MTVAAPSTGTVAFSIAGQGTSIANTYRTLYVYGSFTLPASGCTFDVGASYGTFTLQFMSPGGTYSRTLTTNGVTLTLDTIRFYDASTTGTTTLGSALTLVSYGKIVHGTGNFNTGGWNVTTGYFSTSDGTAARSLTLGTSTITLLGNDTSGILPWNAGTIGGLTFSGASSTIVFNGTGSFTSTYTFSGGGLTYGTVTFNYGSSNSAINYIINGTNTFTNFNVTSAASSYMVKVSLGADQTVAGSLSLGSTGLNPSNRVFVYSSVAGTTRTIFATSVGGLYNVDFLDITAGAASFSGTSLGNCGGNSNITFPAAKTVYIVSSSTSSDAATAVIWATSSGGSTSAANFPLPQDTIIIDNSTQASATSISNLYFYNLGTINGSSRTTATTISINTALSTNTYNIFGSLILGTYVTFSGTFSSLNFNGRSAYSITCNGKSLPFSNIGINAPGGTYTHTDQCVITGGAITVYAGTYDTGNQAMAFGSLTTSGTITRTINLGSSTIVLSSTNPITITSATGLTFNAGTSNIQIQSTIPGTFSFGALTYYNLEFQTSYNFSVGGSATFSGTGGGPTFNNLTIRGRTTAGVNRFILTGNITVNGTFTVGAGTTPGTSRTVMYASTYGLTQRVITAAAVSLADVDFLGIVAAGASGTWTGTRLGDGGSNSNITFPAAKTVYYVGTTSSTFSASNWATSSGGATSNLNFPLPQDTIIIDNSSLNTSAVLTYDYFYLLGNLDASSRTNAITIAANVSVLAAGNITLSSAVTLTGGASTAFIAVGPTCNLTSAGVVFPSYILVQMPTTGTLTLVDSLTTTNTTNITQLVSGTLDLNGNSLTCISFSLTGGNTRGIKNGSIYITGSAVSAFAPNTICAISTTTNLTITGTVNIYLTYSGSTGTRVITAATGTTGQNINYYVTAGSDVVSFNNTVTNYLNTLDFNGFSGTLSGDGTNGARNITGNFRLSSGMTIASQGGYTTTFAGTSGTKTITTNGQTLDFPINFSGSGATFQLQDAMTAGSTRIFTLTAGTLDLNNYNLTCGLFSSSNSNTRSISFGTGQIYITGSSTTVLTMSTYTNFSCSGSRVINLTYAGSTGTRIVSALGSGAVYAQTMDIIISSGSDSISFGGNARNLNFTGFSGTWASTAAASGVWGPLVFSAGMTIGASTNALFLNDTGGTYTVTTNGQIIDNPVSVLAGSSTVQLADAMVLGSTRTFTLSSGTLDLNNKNLTCGLFSSSSTNTRTLAFGTGQIYLTAGSATIWSADTQTNFNYTGTAIVNATYSGSVGSRGFTSGLTGGTESNAINFNVTNGSDTIIFYGSSRKYGFINLTGFSGIWSSPNWTYTLYGGLTIPSGVTTSTSGAYTGPITFGSTSGTKTITTNGLTIPVGITLNGAGGTWQLQDAMTVSATSTVTLTNGTLDLNGATLSTGSITTAAGTKNITFNGGTVSLSNNWNNAVPAGFTTTAGTANGVIAMTSPGGSQTFSGGDITYAAALDNANGGAITVTGNNTFYDMTSSYLSSAIKQPIFYLTAGSVQTLGRLTLKGNNDGGFPAYIWSTNTSIATISAGIGALIKPSYVQFIYIAATGGATWRVGPTSGTGLSTGFSLTSLPSRISNTGNHFVNGNYDEVSTANSTANSIDSLGNQIGILDEVTNAGITTSAIKYFTDKTMQITGVFDEVTGIV
jgi:hypothetical protein